VAHDQKRLLVALDGDVCYASYIVGIALAPAAESAPAPAHREERAMSLYFFHLHDHVECIDDEGTELAGLDEVRAYAIRNARSIMAENVWQGEICLGHWIEVVDESWAPVLTLRFAEALNVVPASHPA
jgi:hypothetical protein